MRVLVTGTAGFLGSHVATVLAADGFDVLGFDVEASRHGIPGRLGDLRDFDQVASATGGGIDAVCHLGAVGDIYLAEAEPGLACEVNVLGTANLLEASRRNGVEKFIYGSTWEVYGSPEFQPVTEAHPLRPSHPYNLSKLAGEQLALAYDRFHGLNVVSLRMGTAYGPGMRTNAVIPAFVLRGIRGEPLTVHGDGMQQRQFTHARDLARAYALALRAAVHGEAINVVATEQVRIRDLAQQIASRYSVDLSFTGSRHGDPPALVIDSTKAAEVLNWRPSVPFAEGLDELMEFLANEARVHGS